MMAPLQKQLPELFALAHDHSEEGRIKLADQLSNVFLCDNVQLSSHEEDQLNALIDQLMATSNSFVRLRMIEKFAKAAHLSRLLAMRVALEASDVSREVLTLNEKLTDTDLITIVETKGRTHARHIARRKKITAAVVDALVTTGDIEVMQMVAKNLGAELSAKVVNILTDAARLTSSLQESVIQRPELTEAAAVKLYWWIAADLRRYATKRFNINQGRLGDMLTKVIEEKLNSCLFQKNDDEAMTEVAKWLQERVMVSVALLPQILRLGHFRLFNILLAQLSGLKLAIIDKVSIEAGGRTLAALCRAIGVDKASFVSIFLLSRGARPGEHIVHPRELSFALATFDRLSLKTASDAIQTWNDKICTVPMQESTISEPVDV